MLCQRCGHLLETNAERCPHCNAAVTPPSAVPALRYAESAADWTSKDRPIYVLRPVFIIWSAWLSVLGYQLFLAIWFAGLITGFDPKPLRSAPILDSVPIGLTRTLIACLGSCVVPAIACSYKKWRYARIEYRFYTDRLEHYDPFSGAAPKVVLYRAVQTVKLERRIIERHYDLGTIVFFAQPGRSRQSTWPPQPNQPPDITRAIDVQAPEEVYKAVQDLIQRSQAWEDVPKDS